MFAGCAHYARAQRLCRVQWTQPFGDTMCVTNLDQCTIVRYCCGVRCTVPPLSPFPAGKEPQPWISHSMSIYKKLPRRGGQVSAPTDVCEQCKNYSPKTYLLAKQEMKNIITSLPYATMHKHLNSGYVSDNAMVYLLAFK